MKRFVGLFLFSVLLVALLRIEYSAAREECPQENCLSSNKCELLMSGGLCKEQSASCCSIVKSEFRTHCRHHGGICMDDCNVALQHDVTDCAAGQVCCTLV
ncbi:hypothetical protein KM043_013177 [Ampulex compressa]|nr:hypothetical protein KM043_013177 [Ampulex compressa]